MDPMESVSCDVLVVGSGAGGLSAAITAQHFGCNVLVIEKQPVFGGTTARSRGRLWGAGPPPGGAGLVAGAGAARAGRAKDKKTGASRRKPISLIMPATISTPGA